MQSMETRASPSREHLVRGKFYIQVLYLCISQNPVINISRRFGWVNASYVFGLEFLNAGMRRALGAITPWETYSRAMASQDTAVD